MPEAKWPSLYEERRDRGRAVAFAREMRAALDHIRPGLASVAVEHVDPDGFSLGLSAVARPFVYESLRLEFAAVDGSAWTLSDVFASRFVARHDEARRAIEEARPPRPDPPAWLDDRPDLGDRRFLLDLWSAIRDERTMRRAVAAWDKWSGHIGADHAIQKEWDAAMPLEFGAD